MGECGLRRQSVLRSPLELGAIHRIHIQERGIETAMGAGKGDETDERTSPLWHKTTLALLVWSAKGKGERISPCNLFKEDKEQFMLKDDVDSGINGDYLTWKIQNGNS